MRRLVTFTLFGVLFLSSCRRTGEFPPQDVLRRATIQSGQLQSAEYDADLHAELRRGAVLLRADGTVRGTLAHAGEQAAFSVNLNGTLDRGSDRTAFGASADVVRDALDTYVLLRTLTTDPPSPLVAGLAGSGGTWWKLPGGPGTPAVPGLTPDPAMLRAQSDVVTVIDDRGLQRISGRDAYHYVVSIDADRLLQLMKALAEERGQPFSAQQARAELERYTIRGELWIDADTFVVHRLEWSLASQEEQPATRLRFGATLRNHNAAPPITVPGESQPLPRDLLLQRLLPVPSATGALRLPL